MGDKLKMSILYYTRKRDLFVGYEIWGFFGKFQYFRPPPNFQMTSLSYVNIGYYHKISISLIHHFLGAQKYFQHKYVS